MEPIYAVKSTYDEDMFYHQVVASKPRMMPKEGDGCCLNIKEHSVFFKYAV